MILWAYEKKLSELKFKIELKLAMQVGVKNWTEISFDGLSENRKMYQNEILENDRFFTTCTSYQRRLSFTKNG